ncbi:MULTISPECIES: aspartate aminotransferase family protein [Pseudomonas]|uniref:aspartate aminotransferase family protein n=1 Tax=Pseudomonas TaxID=286 RepID=UPI001AEC7436|nr:MULTISPECIES: aspartate aminotransferase family protein [Pseudomonas]MBP2842989.1 aspartate aminotransferase family protein [Pseudomonas sp. PNP]MDT8923416.1 aspartate aminotransferase family protein [Pseudomonas taiwanensis]
MNKKLCALADVDANSVLHPYTDARNHQVSGPLMIERGEGIYVYDSDGKEYIEAMSGLWSVALGFSNDRLIKAAETQLRTLPFYHIFNGKAHAPSTELAKQLLDLAPVPMSKVFFTNSGSEANDTIVKLLWYRNNALGKPKKKKLISRLNAYHGVTVMSASLTGLPNNHRGFDLPLPQVLHVSCPHYYRYGKPDETEEQYADRLAKELEDLILKEGADTIAAFFGEPLMGAGGVLVPPRTYWSKIQAVCRKYDILLVADEVICGFGRTGSMFGCDAYDIYPDAMLLSKQLSSSYQPIAAVLINDSIFEPIADQSHQIGTLGHGLTATGHPVAAAVSLENIRIIQSENLVGRAAELGALLNEKLGGFSGHPLVGEVRGRGLISAVELVADKATKARFAAPGKVGAYLAQRAQHHGFITRNIGDAIAFCPPLITTEAEIQKIIDRFEWALADTERWYSSLG